MLQSCGGTLRGELPGTSLLPANSTLAVGADVRFSPPVGTSASACNWTSSAPAILTPVGGGLYHGQSAGTAAAVAQCKGGGSVSASVLVTPATPGHLVITHGGAYSGTWTSNDPTIPAVEIATDEPVILHDSILTGRGDLIDIHGEIGADVTVRNVTGTALDPGLAGLQRGSFLSAQTVARLRVKHCSMFGVSYGIRVVQSTLSSLVVAKNLARELEDRASDGQGGLQTSRPSLGHFLFLDGVMAPSGANIGWNQVVDTIGESSTEDVFNIFKSQGSPGMPIQVHDNYMEGYSSSTTASYTGTGLIADGDSAAPVTAYVSFTDNQVVHAAGSGVEIAAGHDILAKNNRVVSCGMDATGKWFAMPFINAVVIWNYYAAPEFHNIVVTGTYGGMLKPDSENLPVTGDIWARTSDLDATDSYKGNNFNDPCLVNSAVNPGAEDAERSFWLTKLAAHGITPGDLHQ